MSVMSLGLGGGGPVGINSVGEPAVKVIADPLVQAGVGRHVNNIGTTKKEVKFLPGDNVNKLAITCGFEIGATIGPQALAICVDCTSVEADALIGTGATIPESLDANVNVYRIQPGTGPIIISFSNPLSYDGNIGFEGNVWVRSLDNLNQLECLIVGAV